MKVEVVNPRRIVSRPITDLTDVAARYIPTPAQIKAATAKIRARWTPAQEVAHQAVPENPAPTIKRVGPRASRG